MGDREVFHNIYSPKELRDRSASSGFHNFVESIYEISNCNLSRIRIVNNFKVTKFSQENLRKQAVTIVTRARRFFLYKLLFVYRGSQQSTGEY